MKKIILIILAVIICVGGITAVFVFNNKDTNNEDVTNKNELNTEIASSSKEITNTISQESINSEKIIEQYVEALNNRDIDFMVDITGISEMNQYAKNILESDEKTTEDTLKEKWKKCFEIMDEYNSSFEIKKMYVVSSKQDIEDMYKKENRDLSDIDDENWKKIEDMLQEYKICYLSLTRNDQKTASSQDVAPSLVLSSNGKIVNSISSINSLMIYLPDLSEQGNSTETLKEMPKLKN